MNNRSNKERIFSLIYAILTFTLTWFDYKFVRNLTNGIVLVGRQHVDSYQTLEESLQQEARITRIIDNGIPLKEPRREMMQQSVGNEVTVEEKDLEIIEKQRTKAPNFALQIDDNDFIYKPNIATDPSWNGAPVVIEEYKLLFFTIPKVGCTTWLQLFRKIQKYKNWKVQGTRKRLPWKPKTNGLKYLYHYNKTDALEMMTSPEWTRAIFLRDPKERFVSAYIDKALNEEMFIPRVCCWETKDCRDKAKESPQAFLHFIRTSCDDDHWRPQSQRMEAKYWPYINFVGYMDSLSFDAKRLLELIGAWDKHGATGWGVNSTERIFQDTTKAGRQHATNAKEKLTKYIDSFEFEQQIEQFYSEDYDHPVLNMTRTHLHSPPTLEERVRISSAPTQSSPFAYAFLIGGIDLGKPESYQQYLYSILVAAKRLREEGSQADIVVLTQYTSIYNNSINTKLPQVYKAVFDEFGIQEILIPGGNGEISFYSIQMEKFFILNLTQYKRVLYMDSDVMPLHNLDYIFNFSMSGKIQSNFIISCYASPADGSFFLLNPEKGDYEQIIDIIEKQKIKVIQNNNTWDNIEGWGHAFEKNEQWESATRDYRTKIKKSNMWAFYAADADQGLLYYWTKYVKQDGTITFYDSVQHWNHTIKPEKAVEETQIELFEPISKFHYAGLKRGSPKGWRKHEAVKFPYDSVHHFNAGTKPWEREASPVGSDIGNGYDLWFQTLREINSNYSLGIDFSSFGNKNTNNNTHIM